jgi:hypothetical protein
MVTMNVKDAAGATVAVEKPLAPGRVAAASSRPITLSSEDLTVLQAISTALGATALDLGQGTGGSRTLRVAVDGAQLDGNKYETVAASQSNQIMGPTTGATGDYLREILVIPSSASPGSPGVQIKDGAGTAITVFAGGTNSCSNLVPFTISLGLISTAGPWQITTGSSLTAIGIGNFT